MDIPEEDRFDIKKCKAALIHHDPEQRFTDDQHLKQLTATFFGRVARLDQVDSKTFWPNIRTIFLVGDVATALRTVRMLWPDVKVFQTKEYLYEEVADVPPISYRRLALRIPELWETVDRLIPIPIEGEEFETLKTGQEWYGLMHANHRDASAIRTGSYMSPVGPLPNSIWLQRCSTIFNEPTQLFGPHHHELHRLEREADSVFSEESRDPNLMLIQEYAPDAIIGPHSDKTLDLESLNVRFFSAYRGFRGDEFPDDPDVMLDPEDFRVFTSKKFGRPVIRRLTLKNKVDGRKINIPLTPNCMLVMSDTTHRRWTHEIRKQPFGKDRISVTSRYSRTAAQYRENGDVMIYRRHDTNDTMIEVGLLHQADFEESKAVDERYFAQNTMFDILPDYGSVILCTRNPGDMKKPKGFE